MRVVVHALAMLATGAVVIGCSTAHILAGDSGLDASARVDAASPGDAGVDTTDVGADAADAGDGGRRCDPRARFTSVLPVVELASPSDEGGLRLAADERTGYFASDRPGGVGGWDVWTATRASATAAFGVLRSVPGANSADHDVNPSVTADGLALYAEHTTSTGDLDLVVAVRALATDDFGPFVPVTELNTVVEDAEPAVLPDHSAIYFVSARAGDRNVFRSARVGGAFEAPVLVMGAGLGTGTRSEALPTVTPDELVLYFAAPGPVGAHDIYVATRASTAEPFGAATVVDELSTSGFDYPTWISSDACVLYLSRYDGAGSIHIASRTP